MKQQETPTTLQPAECKLTPMSHLQSTIPSRFRLNSEPKDQSAKVEARPKTVPPDVKDSTKNRRRSLPLNKPKSGDQLQVVMGCHHIQKGRVVEQFAQPRRPSANLIKKSEENASAKENNWIDELTEKLNCSEALVKDLRSQMLGLRAELDGARSLNMELESLNRKLNQDLAAAEAKIAALARPDQVQLQKESTGEHQSPKFKDIQKLIANKLEHPIVTREAIKEARTVKTPLQAPASLTPKDTGTETIVPIKADVETKGEFINSLIHKVLAAAYTDIEDILQFVDWLDSELSSLADERAVLKHFKWPERKADAMREAAIEYRDIKLLENEISSYEDDTTIPCGAALKRTAALLDKSERSIQRLIKLRNSVMHCYQEYKIPIYWMLDSGIMCKIKRASRKLATMYLKRVATELQLVRSLDKESAQEALLLQGMHYANRARQFAGGLDSETFCAFDEIRQCIPEHLIGSKELLA
ncbi:hypothetical protein CRYUN_Cryun10bG0001000 [Craigia yunnanensis]